MNNDRENEYNESKEKKQKIIMISLISVVIIMLLTVLAITLIYLNKNKAPSDPQNPDPSETKASSVITKTTAKAADPSTSSVTTVITTDSKESSAPSETATVTTEPPKSKEHGFIINNMGYTYLYFGQGFEQFNGTTATAKRYAASLNTVKSKLNENIKFYSIVAPTSVAFSDIPLEIRVEDDFSNSNQNNNTDTINSNLDGFTGINVFSTFESHKDERLFLNTDKNWTARAAYYAYEEFCKASGIDAIPLETYEKTQLEGYLGSFYNATKSSYLFENPDIIECWLVDKTYPVNMTMYSDGLSYSNRQLVTTQISSPVSYAYYAFLGGPGQRFEIKTGNAEGRKILVIGDGSAYAFIPFLAGNYSEIYFINAETYTVGEKNPSIDQYASEKGIEDVLFISYATNTQRPQYCTKINGLCN